MQRHASFYTLRNYKGNSEFLTSLDSLTVNYVPVIMLINIVDYRQGLLTIFINYHWLSAEYRAEWGKASFLVTTLKNSQSSQD